jgi:hypothetical protein
MTSWETTRISDSRSDSELATTTLNIKYSKKSILGAMQDTNPTWTLPLSILGNTSFAGSSSSCSWNPHLQENL